LINENSEHWSDAVAGAISHCSEVWGGRFFLLVPTDGRRIKDKFWELLEAYSPDYIAEYRLTLADLKDSQPERYAQAQSRYCEGLTKAGYTGDLESAFRTAAGDAFLDAAEISNELQAELVSRLSPFHFNSHAVHEYLSHSNGFGFPFTKMDEIIPLAHKQIPRIAPPPAIADPAMKMMAYAQTGAACDAYLDKLRTLGIVVEAAADDSDSASFVEYVIGRRSWITIPNRWADERILEDSPAAISGLHLGQYYRTDRHRPHEEPIVVVVGDTVDDFCFYYSLSRLHDGVFWLPVAWLSSAYRRSMHNRRRQAAGEPQPPTTDEQRLVRSIVNHLWAQIGPGRQAERIELRSMSLNQAQLRSRKTQIAALSIFGVDQRSAAVECKEIAATSTACTCSVIEENNYSTFRSVVFIDGVGVSPIDTPKPKNFSKIHVPGHYWITSLEVEGYMPPSLPYLGTETIKLQGFGQEVRVANDGLAYLCPGSAYFGGDVDVVTVRPRLTLLDDLTVMSRYFGDSGIKVKYSDKGNYVLDTLRRFGGLKQASEFIGATSTRGLLGCYTDHSKSDSDSSRVHLNTDQRSYLNFEAFSQAMNDQDRAADLIDDLVGRDILERGLILQCERCRLSSWYNLEVLTTLFRCNRCGLTQQFRRSHWKRPFEPHWYYRLAETVYQCFSHNSHLTIQVLHKLQAASEHAFHFAPELDLEMPGGQLKEIDIACVADGKIIIGECKTDPLRPAHVTKYEHLTRTLIRKPDRLLFATSEPTVSKDFESRLANLRGGEVMTFEDLFDN
jgi:hypothetical protein